MRESSDFESTLPAASGLPDITHSAGRGQGTNGRSAIRALMAVGVEVAIIVPFQL